MGAALEVITGRVLNVGATLTAVTANTGDSLTVRNAPQTSRPVLESVWAQSATAGVVRIRSNRLHDAAQAIRYRVAAVTIRALDPDEIEQPLWPQDLLTVEQSGGGAETDSLGMLFYYPDLPGVQARLATWDQVKPRAVNWMVQEVAVAGPTTAGDWSAGTALNTTFDTLKANVDYAVLGYITDTACCSIAIRGADTGNVRVGGPGPTEPLVTRDWFVNVSRKTGLPCIPIVNMANKGSVLAFVQLNTAAGTVNVGFSLLELSGS
jgi:hypothetical protein